MSYSYQEIRSGASSQQSLMRTSAMVLAGVVAAMVVFAAATPANAAYASTATRPATQVRPALGQMGQARPSAVMSSLSGPAASRFETSSAALPERLSSFSVDSLRSGVAPVWAVAIAMAGAFAGYFLRRSNDANQLMAPLLVEPHSDIAIAPFFGTKSEGKAKAAPASAPATMRIQGEGLEFPNISMRSTRLRANYEEANPKFMEKMNEIFPGSLFELELLSKSTKVLNSFGFNKENTIPLVGVCRDELTRPLIDHLEDMWGPSFSMGSIAGMIFMGKTGMGAGTAHAPQNADGVERYFFISAPHIGITEEGVVGYCLRPGQHGDSTACGALCALLGELKRGELNVEVNTIDMEQSMMKQQVVGKLQYGEIPKLEDLTKAAQEVVQEQLEAILKDMKLVGKAEYAFLTGVQIHGPDNANFYWPKEFYIVKVDGSRVDIDVSTVAEVDASDLEEVQHAAEFAKALFVVQQGDLPSVKRWVQLGNAINEADGDGETALLVAARSGHTDIVKYLLENGANPKLVSKQGRSPLQEAVENGHDAICQILNQAGCVLPQNVAEFYLWRAAREGKLDLAKRTVQYGPENSVNTRNSQGDSPLFASIRLRNIDVAKFLIAAGADYTGVDIDGNSVEKMIQVRGYSDLQQSLFGK